MPLAENSKIKSPAIPVFIATTVMLSFISFWRVAAVVLSGSGGDGAHGA